MKYQIYVALLLLLNYQISTTELQIIKEVTVAQFAQLNPDAQILACTQNYLYNFDAYPLYKEHAQKRFPNQGLFQDTYIVSIPHGTATLYEDTHWGIPGLVFLNNYYLKECQIKTFSPFMCEQKDTITIHAPDHAMQVQGSLAICWHLYPQCYGHFILDVLCQLALLEIHNVSYDHLCIPYAHTFMQQLLNLWGIDAHKIIPFAHDTTISADQIILPTAVTQTQQIVFFTNYTMDFLIQYVREKLLQPLRNKENKYPDSKKIFISRKDSPLRNLPNEDEIFKIFQMHGFKRYELSKLPIDDQILLFHNAEEIVSFVGSGSTNIIFAKPGTKYIEIVQNVIDATFFFLANSMKLQYYCIDNSTYKDFLSGDQNSKGRAIPISLIQDFLANNSNL